DGTVQYNTFAYQIGPQPVIADALSWSASVRPANTASAVFKYRVAGSTGAFIMPAVGTIAGKDQAKLNAALAAGNYEYVIQYLDGAGTVLQSAGGVFTASASGAVNTTIAFSHRETTISWNQGSQPAGATAVFSYAPAGSS